MRWPWTHPATRQLLNDVAADLRAAVMELEAETSIAKTNLRPKEETDDEHRR